MDFKKEYYQILQVSKNATKEEIKASYRKLALLYHPDRNPGNPDAEEKFKLINESNEILSNDILRHEYDEYKKNEKEWKEKQKEEATKQTTSSSNKKTYQRKNTHTKEKRIYIKGEIIIKYWGDILEEPARVFETEFNYKVNPTEVRVRIFETDIYPPSDNVSSEYQKSFKESELFKSPIGQPVKCTIHTDSGDEYYELELKDIRLKNIRLEGITKHEGLSYGTLKGEIYAYTPKVETYETIEEVTECFGETGNLETKEEGEVTFYRKEYYNADCTTYWSPWYTNKKPATTAPVKKESMLAQASGCLQWWWVPLLFFFIIRFPQFILGLLVLAAIGLIFSFGISLLPFLGRILSTFAAILFFVFLISAIRSFSGKSTSFVKHDHPSYDTLRTTKSPLKKENNSIDTLINHFIRWRDYNNHAYEANLAIAVSDVQSSVRDHNAMDPILATNSLAPAYASMLRGDENKLKYIYNTFDSIRTSNNMNDVGFAKMLVSCVQSIPYFLVVDKSCTDNYDDEYTRNYLASCTRDCCIGYEKYGVRSPAEFVSDLKGDCDTRALFLYALLKRYRYNVALITSQYYKHAMIAVDFSNASEPFGIAMNIHDKNYYLWETTSAGFNVGDIPTYLQNLDYWDIALLNENN